MTNSEMLNLLEAYYAMGKLKFAGHWNINIASDRYESIAESVYAAQQMAWILWSEREEDIDIHKVIAMISLSEVSRLKDSVVLFGDLGKKAKISDIMREFNAGLTAEAFFAGICKSIVDGNYYTDEVLERMPNDEFERITSVYETLLTLKMRIRQGIINWNITGIRRESVAEHVYSVQQLAWLMWMVSDEDIDIFRVVSMLSIHETEESIIGDITPFCGITPEEKLKMGHEAVEKLLGDLKQFDMMYSIIKEFDAEETPDAFFAHLCDKLDCDLAVKFYSDGGYCSIANATEKMKNNPKIQKLIADGGKTVADMFIMSDEHMYTGTIFEEVIDFVKQHDVTKL